MRERAAWLLSRLAGVAAGLDGVPADDRDTSGSAWTLAPVIDEVVRGLRSTVDSPPAATGSAVLERLHDAFGLSSFERDLLLLAGLADSHEAVAHLLRHCHPAGEAAMTPAIASQALALRPTDRDRLARALEAGPLHRHGLLRQGTGPFPDRSLRLCPGLWTVLSGITDWPLDLPSASVPVAGHVEAALSDQVVDLTDAGPALLVVLAGHRRRPVDLAAQVRAILEDTGIGSQVLEAPTVDGRAEDLVPHLVARGLVPVVLGSAERPPLPLHPGLVVVCSDRLAGVSTDRRPLRVVELDPPDLGDVRRMWQVLLPELDGAVDGLASTMRVGPLAAADAAADARAEALRTGCPLEIGMVGHHVRQRTDAALPPAVRQVRPRATFEDLVLPTDQLALLHACVDRVLHQGLVLHRWGFGPVVRGGRGVRLLLAGPPGTGKSLAAEVLAGGLGLDLLVVDLSALVSKWIGETEKHLTAVFEAAGQTQSVLLFDEADAIFGRRSDGADAQSRWANVETAHLLALMDAFEGLVVLTSNMRGAIDDAFLRRLDVVMDLDDPDVAQRAALWRIHLPDAAPIADDVDLGVLAAHYPVTGGLIRNAALGAGFHAAATSGVIDLDALVLSIRREYDKAGRSFPGPPPMPRGLSRQLVPTIERGARDG